MYVRFSVLCSLLKGLIVRQRSPINMSERIHEVKAKVKLSLCLTNHHTMKTYWGSGGIAPFILDLGTRWR
jgi:hypothetical protein